VQQYLETYAQRHGLAGLVTFRAEVRAVRPILPGADGGRSASEVAPGDYSVWRDGEDEELGVEAGQEQQERQQQEVRWRVSYRQLEGPGGNQEEEEEEEEFDAVVVCNGHFDEPYTPLIPGLADGAYKGRVLHSRHYDDPSVCAGRRVLCVGYKSSGTDIARCVRAYDALRWCRVPYIGWRLASIHTASSYVCVVLSSIGPPQTHNTSTTQHQHRHQHCREVARVAKDVHVVDRRVKPPAAGNGHGKPHQEQELQRGNIFRRPELRRFLEDGRSVVRCVGICAGWVFGWACDVCVVCMTRRKTYVG
jgi:hypothetical protein